MKRNDASAGKRILFWADESPLGTPSLNWIADLFGVSGRKPKDFVRNDIPFEDRSELARALELHSTMNPTGGEVVLGYFGYADCRMCGSRLGTRDLGRYGFIWPEKAEHYIMNHNVWTPECDELLIAVRRRRP